MRCLLHRANATEFNQSYRRASNVTKLFSAHTLASQRKSSGCLSQPWGHWQWQQLATAADSWIFVDSRTQTQSWMQISRRCLYAFWTSNRASCLTHDVTRYHHRRVSSWVMRLRMLRATTSLPKQPLAFFIHYSAFLLNDQWEPAAWSLQFNLQCTDDDNRTYRNVCNMSFVSFSLALIFTINRLCPWSLKNILLSLSCEIVHYWTRLHWIFKNQD